MNPRPLLAIALFLLLLPLPAMAETVDTHVSLLVGFPDAAADNEGDMVVSGTVIPINFSLTRHGAGAPYLQSEGDRLLRLRQNLAKTLRLEDVQFAYSQEISLEVGRTHELPGPQADSQLSIEVDLLGFNDQAASYQVRFFNRSAAIADSPLTILRGASAVVGGQDGKEAPYLFLVLAPVSKSQSGLDQPIFVGGDVKPPRAIVKTAPKYTEEARKERLQGVVVLQAIIDRSGAVREVEVLKGLAMGLEEAAVAAIMGWRFEPATLLGKPVEVYYNLTINFRLDSDKEEGS